MAPARDISLGGARRKGWECTLQDAGSQPALASDLVQTTDSPVRETGHSPTAMATHLMFMIAMWHERMAIGLSRRFVGGLSKFRARYAEGADFVWASACSGSDVMFRALAHLAEHWSTHYEVTVNFAHGFSCECDEEKRRFIVAEHSPSAAQRSFPWGP